MWAGCCRSSALLQAPVKPHAAPFPKAQDPPVLPTAAAPRTLPPVSASPVGLSKEIRGKYKDTEHDRLSSGVYIRQVACLLQAPVKPHAAPFPKAQDVVRQPRRL